MRTIIQSGSNFRLAQLEAQHEKLPVGNYLVCYDQQTGFFLQKQTDFTLPEKLYGDFSCVDRWIKSFENNSDKNLGILLSGIKGSGKTVTAKLFCQKINMPVIIITEPYTGPAFEDFISNPVLSGSIVFIDEFEKVYKEKEGESNSLLTIIDGVYTSKLIFLFTVNDINQINGKLKNRLNRIKYHKVFSTLDAKLVEEITDDLLVNKEHKESVMKFAETFDIVTMDVLTAVIKEVNLFDEDALTCAKYLNLMHESSYYKVSVAYKGVSYPTGNCYFIKASPSYCFDMRYEISEMIEKVPGLAKVVKDGSMVEFDKWNAKHTDTESIYTYKANSEIKLIFKKLSATILAF